MESLLRNDFTAHYGLPTSTIANISASTIAPYFELKDDNTLIYETIGLGIAKYNNRNSVKVNVINFESFIDSLAPAFIQGLEKCDLIIHDGNRQHFLLNELTNTLPRYVEPFINMQGTQLGKRQKSIYQLLSSLTVLMNVPAITDFVNTHTFRHCCFFNKHALSPSTITATSAFNRLSSIVEDGLRMSSPAIEGFGFEFWEYSGNQVYNL